MIPKIKPCNLGDLVKEGHNIGKIVGLNTSPIRDIGAAKGEKLLKFLSNELTPDFKTIYFEDIRDFEQSYLDFILNSTGLCLPSGKDIRIFNLPYIISQVYEGLKKSINANDTMIISQEKDTHLKIILQLMDKINFFTCVGLEDFIREEVYNEIFKSTGVSIFQPIHLEKVVRNYSTIINFCEELCFDLENIRNQAVIIDFSKNKPFKILENSKKDVILIEDIQLKINTLSEWIDDFVSPELFEALEETYKIFSHIYTNNDFYRVDDFSLKNKKKSGKI